MVKSVLVHPLKAYVRMEVQLVTLSLVTRWKRMIASRYDRFTSEDSPLSSY
jgi:hypothetical protein